MLITRTGGIEEEEKGALKILGVINNLSVQKVKRFGRKELLGFKSRIVQLVVTDFEEKALLTYRIIGTVWANNIQMRTVTLPLSSPILYLNHIQ